MPCERAGGTLAAEAGSVARARPGRTRRRPWRSRRHAIPISRAARCSSPAAARASARPSCARSPARGVRVGFVDIADAPSRALVASLAPARVHYEHCDVRDIAALKRAITAVRGRARPDHRAGQQRRARRPPCDDGRDRRVLGREPGGQPAPPGVRDAGRRADDGSGRRRARSSTWARCRGCAAGRRWSSYTTAKAAIGRLTRVLARELGDRRTSASTRSFPAPSSPSGRRACGRRPRPSARFLDAAVPQVPAVRERRRAHRAVPRFRRGARHHRPQHARRRGSRADPRRAERDGAERQPQACLIGTGYTRVRRSETVPTCPKCAAQRRQGLRRHAGDPRHRPRRSARASSSCSSVRRAAASRRCCA